MVCFIISIWRDHIYPNNTRAIGATKDIFLEGWRVATIVSAAQTLIINIVN